MAAAHPYPPPCFPPVNDKLLLNFTRTLMSSEVALRYLPPSLNCSPTTSPRAQISCIVSPFSPPMSIAGRAFHDADARLPFSSVRWRADRDGVARWMGRGSRLVRCPHSEIVDEVRIYPLDEKEDECRVAGAGCIQFPTCFPNFFLCKPEPTCSMKHVRRSDLPPPREDSSPTPSEK